MTTFLSFVSKWVLIMKLFGSNVLEKPPQPQPCLGTIFGFEGDKYAGGEAVCVHRKIRPNERGIALRDAPCGTRYKLTNPDNGRVTYAKVMDHGPYGALIKDRRGKVRWGIKRREQDPGDWRGCVDMSVQVAKDLHHDGLGPVIVEEASK